MSTAFVRLFPPGKLLQKCFVNTKKLGASQGLHWQLSALSSPRSAAFSTSVKTVKTSVEKPPVSKAMKAYLERAQTHDKFMAEQSAEYEIGLRHLANIMGEDPETFTDEDRDRAIAYLFPSGLFEPRARPHLKPPSEIFQKRKAAEFDESGRPFSSLFYTGRPNYYQLLHDISEKVVDLDIFGSRMNHYNVSQDADKSLNIGGTEWLSKTELESRITEAIKDYHYEFFIKSMNRVIAHPFAYKAKDFVMKYRKDVTALLKVQEIPKLMFTAEGVPYMTASGKRKSAKSTVTVYGRGSGNITINGKDILYFSNIQDKEQIVYPLQFTGLLGTVDVIAEVEGGGSTGQSGAVRYALAMCLRSFVDSEMVEEMRLAGLLTQDPRRRERKKPGQKGARAKFTWKKR